LEGDTLSIRNQTVKHQAFLRARERGGIQKEFREIATRLKPDKGTRIGELGSSQLRWNVRETAGRVEEKLTFMRRVLPEAGGKKDTARGTCSSRAKSAKKEVESNCTPD